jgi:acyl-coenzyme A thioesterase 13
MKTTTPTPLEIMKGNIGKEFSGSPSPFTHWLQPMIMAAESGSVSFRFTVRKDMINPIGTLHGGVTASIMDDVIGAAVYTLNEEHFFTTINNVVDYFIPSKENDVIVANAHVIKKGRQIINAQCEIWNEERSRLLARGYSNLLRTDIKKG